MFLMQKVAKWGFGFAPQKKDTLRKRISDIKTLLDFMQKKPLFLCYSVCEVISDVKGLFNRIRRQDQWDWFTVYMYFDYPSIGFCFHTVNDLANLRSAVIQKDVNTCESIIDVLMKTGFTKYLNNYLSFSPNREEDCEYIYILSRREEKELLKIGMTTRNIEKRIKEINSATGIVYPLSPRAVWRVKDGKTSERLIHEALQEFRLRNDREFFLLPFGEACKKIEYILNTNNMLWL